MTSTNPCLRVLRLFNRPLFGTRVIPAHARVPAAEFPEDDFPVFCPRCHYLLRGLPDSRCPECGEPFDRGRLLVDQYVRERDHHLWKRGGAGRRAGRLAAATMALFILYILGTHVAARWAAPLAQKITTPTAQQVSNWVDVIETLHRLMWWVQAILLALLVSFVLIWIRAAHRNARKRQQVLKAIPIPPVVENQFGGQDPRNQPVRLTAQSPLSHRMSGGVQEKDSM